MERIDYLFANDTLPESWDQQKADKFQHLVYRLTEENRCVSKYIYSTFIYDHVHILVTVS